MTLYSIKIENNELVANLKRLIKVDYNYVLLNSGNKKLSDSKTLSHYKIINDSILIAFEIKNKDGGTYNIYENRLNIGFKILGTIQLEGSENILEIKDVIYQKWKILKQNQKLKNS